MTTLYIRTLTKSNKIVYGQNLTKTAKLEPLLTMPTHSVFAHTDYD